MPGAGKSAGSNPSAKISQLPFEEALKRLESIVEAMESEELALEALLARYEEGTQLARHCQEKMAEAELKIQRLEKTAEGELRTRPMALEESGPPSEL